MSPRILSADAAAGLIQNGQTLIVEGSSGFGVAEAVLAALERRFQQSGAPRDLTLIHTTGVGDRARRGVNHLAHEGMLRRVIGGNWGLMPSLMKLMAADKMEAYNFPQGVLCQLYREIAAGKPGVISHVGLGTFMDPRQEGGKMNPRTTEELVEVVELAGREWLFYRGFRPDVALLRGTTADERGNITLEHECALLEHISVAQAVRNSGGTVIAQVKRIVARGQLPPQQVKVPGILVDVLVVEPDAWQTWLVQYQPAFSGEYRIPLATLPPLPLTERKLIARRAAMALREGMVINLGVGMAEGVARVAAEEGISEAFALTIEAGVIGGVPASELNFGSAYNPEAIIDQPYQFDFYDGGGLDMGCVSFAQVDRAGNVNVTRFAGRVEGAGGFIDITQNAKAVCFLGAFVGGGLDVAITPAGLSIQREGKIQKFIPQVEQVSFNGRAAAAQGKPVLYITERAVFALTPEGVELREIAPGVDLERDVLGQMGFRPRIPVPPRPMDARLFREGRMGLRPDQDQA
jgi:propionate CoA-transferase